MVKDLTIEQPQSSPSSPQAKTLYRDIQRLEEISAANFVYSDMIAEGLFEILQGIDNNQVTFGSMSPSTIDLSKINSSIKDDPNLSNYLKILNGLFRLSNASEIGATRNLSVDLVNEFDIITASRARLAGGNPLLKTLIDVANVEIQERKPKSLVSQVEVVKFGQEKDQSR